MNYVCLQGNATQNHPLLRGVENPKFVDFAHLPTLISRAWSVHDTLIVVNELPETATKIRGRPKNMGNGTSSLDNRMSEIEQLITERKMKRGDLAAYLEVGRVTLNDFIAAKLPHLHKKKG